MEKTKKKEIIILSIILLSTIFLLLILGATFSYFNKNKDISGQIQLGELDFTVNTSAYNNFVMPGDSINLTATISNKVEGKNNLIPFYFRFKLSNNEEYSITLNTDNFVLGQDEYYYYKFKLAPNSSATLFSSIKIDENITSQTSVDVSIIVDAVQSEYGAYLEIFENAPQEWIDFIENN